MVTVADDEGDLGKGRFKRGMWVIDPDSLNGRSWILWASVSLNYGPLVLTVDKYFV